MKYKVERTDGTEIPPDEPCFVLRAKDCFTPKIVKAYYDMAEHYGAPQKFLDEIDEHLTMILEFQWRHPERVKFPD